MNLKKLLIVFSLFSSILIFSQSTPNYELWGMTRRGGTNGQGTIFKTDNNGDNYTVKYSFPLIEGFSPEHTKLCKDNNGAFFGLTSKGGNNNLGVIFQYNPVTNEYIKRIDFSSTLGGVPFGSLISASNGKLYGLTSEGGSFNKGTIFEFLPLTNTITKLYDFSGQADGGKPFNSLIQASNGKLYGITSTSNIQSGYPSYDYSIGVLFEFDPINNTYTAKGTTRSPYGNLMQASNNKIYFTTAHNHTGESGRIVEYDLSTNNFITKFSSNSFKCYGGLIEASNGKFYGLSSAKGGTTGALFEFNILNNSYTIKHELADYNEQNPYGNLMQASNGKLYGLSSGINVNNGGSLFEYDYQTDAFTIKKIFDSQGFTPKGTPIENNGVLIGLCRNAEYPSVSSSTCGLIFEYNLISQNYSKKIVLNTANNGGFPQGSLTKASNGKLYGLTSNGGINDLGVIFEFDPITNIYKKVFDFTNLSGGNPKGSLLQASNGKLYGLTYSGGTIPNGMNGGGTLFEFDFHNYTFTKHYDFISTSGYNPKDGLIQTSNGKLYGMTYWGGTNISSGTIFEFDITTNTLQKKHDFTGNGGDNPNGNLLEVNNNLLYGLTENGGSSGNGVIFEFNVITNNYSVKKEFINGMIRPHRSLAQGNNGRLYGVTNYSTGGTPYGGIFYYDIAPGIYGAVSQSYNGYNKGALLKSSNGKLYGFTQGGSGNVYELDPLNNTITMKVMNSNFTGYDNVNNLELTGSLIELDMNNLVTQQFQGKNNSLIIYPNPFNDEIKILLNENIKFSVKVLNTLGQELKSFDVNELESTISLSQLNEGIYFINFYSLENKLIFSKKILKK